MSDTPLFDALAREYADRYSFPYSYAITHRTYQWADTTRVNSLLASLPKPNGVDTRFAANLDRAPDDSYGNALRDAASQYTPRYEYPEQPRDVPKYTVDYRYNAHDGRKRTIRLSDDEHAVLRVEPFWG